MLAEINLLVEKALVLDHLPRRRNEIESQIEKGLTSKAQLDVLIKEICRILSENYRELTEKDERSNESENDKKTEEKRNTAN